MVLTLFLLRHAKAEKGSAALADFDRPLSDQGQMEADAVALLMRERGYRPSRILCSPALRTRETLVPQLGDAQSGAAIEYERRIYDAEMDALLDIIRSQEAQPSLMLVGHNPGLEDLARWLAGGGDGDALSRLRTKFPPASLAVLTFDLHEWSDLLPGRGQLQAFETEG